VSQTWLRAMRHEKHNNIQHFQERGGTLCAGGVARNSSMTYQITITIAN